MPRYFLVFQGDTYDEEKELSCLWAPKKNKSGNEVHHHKRLLEVNEGDRVIHLVNRYIKAISTVRSKAYDAEKVVFAMKESLRSEQPIKINI